MKRGKVESCYVSLSEHAHTFIFKCFLIKYGDHDEGRRIVLAVSSVNPKIYEGVENCISSRVKYT